MATSPSADMPKPLRMPASAASRPLAAQRRAAEGAFPQGSLPQFLDCLVNAPEVDDAGLVRRSMAGDQDAFAALVARYQKRAFWIAFHVLGRVEDARDVAQEAFVRLFRSLDRFDFARSFYTWFYRIVMNLAIDHLRKHKSSPATSLEEWQEGLPGGDDDSSAPMQRAEQNQLVWRVLDRLDCEVPRRAGAARHPRAQLPRDRADPARHARDRALAPAPRPADVQGAVGTARQPGSGMNSLSATSDRQLPGFVADELAAAAAEATRQHLRGCLACRQQASLHLQAHRRCARSVSLPGVDEVFLVADLQADGVPQVAARRRGGRSGSRSRGGWGAGGWLPVAALGSSGRRAVRVRLVVRAGRAGPVALWTAAVGDNRWPFRAVKAVPWSGSRIALRPLGDEAGRTEWPARA